MLKDYFKICNLHITKSTCTQYINHQISIAPYHICAQHIL